MEIKKSKFDATTTYRLTAQYVVVARDGEEMKFPYRQIPTLMHRFIPEIQEELQEIYDWKYPMHPCPICGTQ